MKASVKIMRSYDYNHFEVSLSTDEDVTLEQVDDMRKQAARLADKAVEQYKVARQAASRQPNQETARQARIIKENYPQSEWTEEQKAIVKKHQDDVYWSSRNYDYEDDYVIDSDEF